MKKFTILIAAIALVCFSVPAMAVDWNFYGSARMETFYTSEDLKDVGEKSTDLRWDMHGNSRVGANVKADHIKGQFETGWSDKTNNVTARRLYGVWNFGAGTLKVGKDYTPLTQFISAQAFDADLGLLYMGAPYASRHGQVALGFGGFEVAFITPKTGNIDDEFGVATDGLERRMIPKIEASWGMAFDAFNFKIMGGYNYYSLKDVDSITNPGDTNDIGVTSYMIAGGGTFNFGPAYVGAQALYGRNTGNAGWKNSYYDDWDKATWDGDDDTNDVDSYGGILVAGMKVSDMLSFELGGGYVVNDPKDADVNDEKTKGYSVYLNSTIALAPGVFLVPEVGMLAFGNNPADQDQGSQIYLGAKWQINF